MVPGPSLFKEEEKFLTLSRILCLGDPNTENRGERQPQREPNKKAVNKDKQTNKTLCLDGIPILVLLFNFVLFFP